MVMHASGVAHLMQSMTCSCSDSTAIIESLDAFALFILAMLHTIIVSSLEEEARRVLLELTETRFTQSE